MYISCTYLYIAVCSFNQFIDKSVFVYKMDFVTNKSNLYYMETRHGHPTALRCVKAADLIK